MPSFPVAALVAVTQEAQRALGGRDEIRFTHFPFKVGRESRLLNPDRPLAPEFEQQRLGVAPQLNDIYLVERSGRHLHVSHEHFAIDYADNRFFLIDRGSACGTIVGGKLVGGHRAGGRAELRNGDTVVVGTASSPYVFRFQISAQ